MGPSPAAFVRTFDPAVERRRLAPRTPMDWREGSGGAAVIWRRMLEEAARSSSSSWLVTIPSFRMSPTLEAFGSRTRNGSAADLPQDAEACWSSGNLFPRPSAGSACKRLNLFLRWMVRRDAIDLGVWSGLSSARLIVPLDTHVIRLGQCLGLTRYRTPGWKMAADITAALRRVNPDDPVRYDFSLCHVGMMNAPVWASEAARPLPAARVL